MNNVAPSVGSEKWDSVIESKKSVFNLHLGDVWSYRDLLMLLVRRDVVSFYKQTIFGPLWFFIQPVFTTIVYTVIFSRVAGIATGDVPAPLFYLAGTILWNYFSECLLKTSTVLRDNSNILGKVYFPRLIMPLSIVLSNLVKLGVQFILFVIVYLYYYFTTDVLHPNPVLFAFPFVILFIALIGLGSGLIVTALTTKYRDLSFLVTFGVQLAMYATPIIYPLSTAKGKLKTIVSLNPLSGLVETFRFGFLGNDEFEWKYFIYSVVASLVILVIGLVIFNKVEKDFVDTI